MQELSVQEINEVSGAAAVTAVPLFFAGPGVTGASMTLVTGTAFIGSTALWNVALAFNELLGFPGVPVGV
jgi:hypothetical protein